MNLCTRANERINYGTVDPLKATGNLLMILRHGKEPFSALFLLFLNERKGKYTYVCTYIRFSAKARA